MTSSLGTFDLVLLVASMAMSALVGLYFTNKNKSIDAYMLGDRGQSVIPVAISLMTSTMSGLTMLGSSSEFYYQGPQYSMIASGILLCGPIIAFTVLPVFHRMNELSLYKYLERRYGSSLKFLVSIVYVIQFTAYNSIVLYLPAMALQALLGIDKFYSVLVIGLMCVVYSSFGGLKAVVWTDFFQAILMYASLIVVGALGTIDAGGFLQVFKNANDDGRFRMDNFFELNITVRHTLLGVVLGSTIKHIYVMGVNQAQMQRALSLPSLKKAQQAFIWQSIFAALISLFSSYLGLVLYSAYGYCDPYLAHEIPKRDAIIVHYVARRLKQVPGLLGIFVAGVFSATLSTLSSFANSMAALAIEDFVKPARKKLGYAEMEEKSSVWLAKIVATLFGIVCVLMAYLVDKANSRLIQASTLLFGAIGTPFLAAFALGIYTRFTNTVGILTGLLLTVSMGIYIVIVQTFVSPPLKPVMATYYGDQCAAVFNASISSKMLQPIDSLPDYDPVRLPEVRGSFSIAQISYMTMPIVQFVLTIIISSLVSILTGGWNNQVSDDCLSSILHKKDQIGLQRKNNLNSLQQHSSLKSREKEDESL